MTSTPDPSRSLRPSAEISGSTTTLRGVVEDGVEDGCLVLRTDDGVFSLLGGDRVLLAAGGRVEVTGSVGVGLVTTCQQGTPFVVDTVVPVPD